MRNWPLYDLHDQDFERLAVLLCEKILGTATIPFSTGPDGGRDAVFKGTAQNFPSRQNPYSGKFIIQAKHTRNSMASCSDAEFKGKLKKEIPKLQEMIRRNEVDYYLLFTNRRLTGVEYGKISDYLDTQITVEAMIIGEEKIQVWLNEYPDVVNLLNLNTLLLPFQFYEDDLKKIIIKFNTLKDGIGTEIKKTTDRWQFMEKEQKNKRNNLGKEYFEEMIVKKSLSYFEKIGKFLNAPANSKYLRYYESTVEDLQEYVLIKRDQYGKFEELFAIIYDYINSKSSEDWMQYRRLQRIFLHYMYWHCDIGVGD